MIHFVREYVPRPISPSVAKGVMHTIVLTFFMGVIVFALTKYLHPMDRSKLGSILALASIITIGGITYLASAYFTKAEELSWLRKKS